MKYLNTKQIVDCDCYPFSLGQIRHFITMRHKNGLDKTIRKIGKRIYFRKDLFEEWIESHK